jgi:OHCU decarboxylase
MLRGRRQPMRGNAEAHELIAPGNLATVLELLAATPGKWTPIAGGTELMVAHAAGKLTFPRLVSLWGIPDLRFIDTNPQSIIIGAGTTFLDLRAHAELCADFPLLARAASWIGSIANQSRATLGGNLVNGSPAADSSPPLLVYDATIEMISTRGSRRVPYSDFHTGYKKNLLAADELLLAIHLPRRFSRHKQYLRKVGTRRAMAIAKVALAGTASLDGGVVNDIRLAAASLAPYPARLYNTEAALIGQKVTTNTIRAACAVMLAEVRSIDDLRSTAAYRNRVGANLLEEFLAGLRGEEIPRNNETLAAWNTADRAPALEAMLACCGAPRWAEAMVASRPIRTAEDLSAAADHAWGAMAEADWLEAFASHPRIGARKAGSESAPGQARATVWSREEQSSVASATEAVLSELAQGNALYEQRFGFTYIVRAAGRSAQEMLEILKTRLASSREAELREAAEQQRQIMQIRLGKWLGQ